MNLSLQVQSQVRRPIARWDNYRSECRLCQGMLVRCVWVVCYYVKPGLK